MALVRRSMLGAEGWIMSFQLLVIVTGLALTQGTLPSTLPQQVALPPIIIIPPITIPEDVGPTCREHVLLYSQELEKAELGSWALRMFDASTKIPEGLSTLSFTNLGNYDACLTADAGNFTGMYCMATMQSVTTTPTTNRRHVRSSVPEAYLPDLAPRTTRGTIVQGLSGLLKFAVCMPSTCNTSEVAMVVSSLLSNVNASATVGDRDCQTSEGPTMRTVDWVAAAIILFVVVLVILSSLYDFYTDLMKAPRNDLLLAFSLLTNGRRLLSASKSTDMMGAVNGVRFLSISWVVLGHRYNNSIALPILNSEVLYDFMADWRRMYINNGTLSVDTFLMLSGMLVTYVFLREVQKKKTFNLPYFYLHRYIRLTPVYAMLILVYATLMQFLGSGPVWLTLMDQLREGCEENWWTNILYVNNYVNIDKMCAGHSWYLSMDMQLYILSPLILIPLWKWPKVGRYLLGLFILGGWATAFSIAYTFELLAVLRPTNVNLIDRVWKSAKMQYFPTHTRFTVWVVGVALGYILVELKNRETKLKLTKVQVLVGWAVCAVLLVASLTFATPFMQPDYEYNAIESAMHTSLFRTVWAMGVAWVIFACVAGYGGPVNTLLSWEVFQPLSRISYCIYLMHPIVQICLMNDLRVLIYFRETVQFPLFLGDLACTIAVATVMSLLFESPVMIIEKAVRGKFGRGKQLSKECPTVEK